MLGAVGHAADVVANVEGAAEDLHAEEREDEGEEAQDAEEVADLLDRAEDRLEQLAQRRPALGELERAQHPERAQRRELHAQVGVRLGGRLEHSLDRELGDRADGDDGVEEVEAVARKLLEAEPHHLEQHLDAEGADEDEVGVVEEVLVRRRHRQPAEAVEVGRHQRRVEQDQPDEDLLEGRRAHQREDAVGQRRAVAPPARARVARRRARRLAPPDRDLAQREELPDAQLDAVAALARRPQGHAAHGPRAAELEGGLAARARHPLRRGGPRRAQIAAPLAVVARRVRAAALTRPAVAAPTAGLPRLWREELLRRFRLGDLVRLQAARLAAHARRAGLLALFERVALCRPWAPHVGRVALQRLHRSRDGPHRRRGALEYGARGGAHERRRPARHRHAVLSARGAALAELRAAALCLAATATATAALLAAALAAAPLLTALAIALLPSRLRFLGSSACARCRP